MTDRSDNDAGENAADERTPLDEESESGLDGIDLDGEGGDDLGDGVDLDDEDLEDIEDWDGFGVGETDSEEVDSDGEIDLGRDRTGDPLDGDPPDDWERWLEAPDRTLDPITGYEELRARLDQSVVGRYRTGGMEMVPNGLLLTGPDGVGKRRFVDALAGELGSDVVRIGARGGSLHDPFERPYQVGDRLAVVERAARSRPSPCLLHVRPLDALDGPEPPVSVDALVDRLSDLVEAGALVVGVATTVEAVPETLAEWFEVAYGVPTPDPGDRRTILESLLGDRPTAPTEADWEAAVDATSGSVRDELEWVAREASYAALDEGRERGEIVPIGGSHLLTAAMEWGNPPAGADGDRNVPGIGPTDPFGEPFTSLPSVHGPEGSLSRIEDDRLAERLESEIVMPLERADLYEEYGVSTPSSALLCTSGPGRRADTVRALAGELGYSVVADDARRWVVTDIDGAPDRMSAFFDAARREAPCLAVVAGLDRALDGRFTRSERGHTEGRVTNQLLQELTSVHGEDVLLVGLAGAAAPVDDAILKRLRVRLGASPRPDRRMSVLRGRLDRHPVEVADLDRGWCLTMTDGLDVAEIERVADLAAERATRTEVAVTEDEIENALRRHLTIAAD